MPVPLTLRPCGCSLAGDPACDSGGRGAVAPGVAGAPGVTVARADAPTVASGYSSWARRGNSRRTVAVAAVSALTATPDTRASVFIVDLLPRRRGGWMRGVRARRRDIGRSPGPPAGQQLFRAFFRRNFWRPRQAGLRRLIVEAGGADDGAWPDS